jgi:hypothetical protein
MSVLARAIPDYVLAAERERLLAMVDILESVPPEEDDLARVYPANVREFLFYSTTSRLPVWL